MNEVTNIGATVRLTRESGQVVSGKPEDIIHYINKYKVRINEPDCLPQPYRNMIHPDLIVKP